MPLLKRLMIDQGEETYENLAQQWYADDAASGGKLNDIHTWWSRLCQSGPLYGYHPKPSKSCIIVKTEYLEKAKQGSVSLPQPGGGSPTFGNFPKLGE